MFRSPCEPVRSPGLRTANLSLQKEFPLGDFKRLEFRAEFFNITKYSDLECAEHLALLQFWSR